MEVIEIFALIIALLAGIKILVLLVNPRVWYKVVVKNVYSKPALTKVIALLLAVVVLSYLLQAGITIVDIFAVMLLLMLLMAMGFVVYSGEVLRLADRMLRDHTLIKKSWLPLIIWIALIVWLLYSLFA